MELREFQDQIERIYLERDAARGVDRSFVWFTEEVGELAKELRQDTRDKTRLKEEMSDVLAWLVTLASLLDIDIAEAARRYADGCPKCHGTPCRCGNAQVDVDTPEDRSGGGSAV
jgi:NTP pyrophosphatase (non-canonical NTP hydrolase)